MLVSNVGNVVITIHFSSDLKSTDKSETFAFGQKDISKWNIDLTNSCNTSAFLYLANG